MQECSLPPFPRFNFLVLPSFRPLKMGVQTFDTKMTLFWDDTHNGVRVFSQFSIFFLRFTIFSFTMVRTSAKTSRIQQLALARNKKAELRLGRKKKVDHLLTTDEFLKKRRSEAQEHLSSDFSDQNGTLDIIMKSVRALIATNKEIWKRCKKDKIPRKQ